MREVAPNLNADEEVRWLEAAELADFDGVHELPGAPSAIGALSDSEWAVVTSGGQELARRRLAHANLRIPRIVVAAENVQLGKPAPDGYQLAAAQLGVDPASCLVIEDTPAGIQSGCLAGAQVLALTTTFPETALLGATVVVNSLADVEIRRVASGLLVHVMHGVA